MNGLDMGREKTSRPRRIARETATPVRRAVDDALLIREEWLRLAAKGSPLGLWHWNERTHSLFCDPNARRMFGVPPTGDVTQDSICRAVHPNDQGAVRLMWRHQLEGRGPSELEYRVVAPDGSVRWIDLRGGRCYDRDGTPLYVLGVVFDVTDRKRVEQERLDLATRLMEAQEQERKRLAQEIHDDFCQRFALVILKLAAFSSAGGRGDLVIDEVISDVTELEQDLQSLSHRLYSHKLTLLGLAPSVDGLCTQFARECGVRMCYEHADVPGDLDPTVALSLFRVTQEALHNIAKHSGASTVEVQLRGTSAGLVLMVLDDGKGLTWDESAAREGIGIRGMRERVHLLGGTLQFQSRPVVQGTRLTVSVPTVAGGS